MIKILQTGVSVRNVIGTYDVNKIVWFYRNNPYNPNNKIYSEFSLNFALTSKCFLCNNEYFGEVK